MRHPNVPGRSLRCVEMENGIIRTKDLWRFIMEFFGNIIKGVMIGIANIIPGVSGGTMAVSLDIYDRLIGAVSGLFKEF